MKNTFALLLAPSLLLATVSVYAKENVAEIARRCQSGDPKACRQLAAIAATDKSNDMRRMATDALTDQTLIAKIAVTDRDGSVRAAAVRRLTDQALLADIAVRDTDAAVHGEAVGRLSDQSLLARFAMEDNDAGVRNKAAGRVTDQALLARIAESRTMEAAAVREAHAAVMNYLAAAGSLQASATRPFLSADCKGDLVTEFQANERSGWGFSSSDSAIENETVNSRTRTATVVARVVFKGGGTFMGKSQTFFLTMEGGAWKISRFDPLPSTTGPGVMPLGKF
ncbi:MAG: hypothetical protein ACLQOO_13145 [Terriglobia bacterium]